MKFSPQWMKFDEVSSYRIVDKWEAHLRKFWSVGGDVLSWQRWSFPSSGGSR
jgi:hypothetical protein